MRIGVDVRCLMDGRRTGVEEYTLGVLRAMIRAAPEDTFLLFANSRKAMRLPAFPEPNVKTQTFSYPNKLFTLSLKVARAPALDALLGGVDVFFVPSVRLAPLSSACPLVLTIHDISFVRHPDFFSRGRRAWHWLMEPERLVRRAAGIIAVSEATAREVTETFRVPRERVSVIPSGISLRMERVERGDDRRARARERYGLPRRFLLFLGTLEPRKNLDGLLLAYQSVRQEGFPHALVLSGVRGWVDRAFFRRLRAHPYAPDILLTDFVLDDDKPAVYSLAELFVYPSFYEGFGFPPLEALAAGTPVVTSFSSAIPEVAGEWSALVNPSDPGELASVISERLRHPVSVPAEVRVRIRERNDWAKAGRATLQVLRSAAGARGATSPWSGGALSSAAAEDPSASLVRHAPGH